MNNLEAIYTRHSVRRYIDRPIEADKLDILRFIKNFVKYEGNEAGKAVEEANAASGLSIQLVVDEPKAFNGLFITTYGQFYGVKNYLVMAAPKGKEWEAKAKDLSGRFIKNFVKYEGNEAGKALVAAGPQL